MEQEFFALYNISMEQAQNTITTKGLPTVFTQLLNIYLGFKSLDVPCGSVVDDVISQVILGLTELSTNKIVYNEVRTVFDV